MICWLSSTWVRVWYPPCQIVPPTAMWSNSQTFPWAYCKWAIEKYPQSNDVKRLSGGNLGSPGGLFFISIFLVIDDWSFSGQAVVIWTVYSIAFFLYPSDTALFNELASTACTPSTSHLYISPPCRSFSLTCRLCPCAPCYVSSFSGCTPVGLFIFLFLTFVFYSLPPLYLN